MTSQEIFRQINPQAMLQQEMEQKLQEAQTGVSKQMIVTQAMMKNQMHMQPQQPMGQMPQQTNPQGWGRTA